MTLLEAPSPQAAPPPADLDVIEAVRALPPDRQRAFLLSLTQPERAAFVAAVDERRANPYFRFRHDPVGFMTSPVGLGEAAWSLQRDIMQSVRDNPRTAVPACHAPGKQISWSEPCLSATGWVAARDVKVGTTLIDADGSLVPVTGVYPQGVRATYRVTFNDGQWMDTGPDHLWTVRQRYAAGEGRACAVCSEPVPRGHQTFCAVHGSAVLSDRGLVKHCSVCLDALPVAAFTSDQGKPDGLRTLCRECHGRRRRGEASAVEPHDRSAWRTATTAELLAYGGSHPVGHRRAEIPVVAPIRFPTRQVPFDPYLLGLLLGDAHIGRGSTQFGSQDPELIAAFGPRLGSVSVRKDGFMTATVRRFRPVAEALGIAGQRAWEKHVPDAYLYGDVEQRLALLRGLMDTDGTVDVGSATTEFSTTSPRLASAVEFLAQSLGGLARTSDRVTSYTHGGVKRQGRTSYRVSLTVPVNPFRLARKAERWNALHAARRKPITRKVESIIYVRDEEAVCFAVDSPSRTFLGRGCIVTHNTHIAARIIAWWGSVHPAGTARILTTATSFRQVKNILWPYLRRTHTMHALPGRMNLTEWRIGPPSDPSREILAEGVKPPDEDEHALSGLHAPHVLIVVDEAGGISHAFGQTLVGLMTGSHTRLLLIGNPAADEEGSWFEKQCELTSLYNVIRIPATLTPNWTGEDAGRCGAHPEMEPHSVSSHLVDQAWAADLARQYGEGSAIVLARRDAIFPKNSASKVLPQMWLEACLVDDEPGAPDPRRRPGVITLGVDIAAGGTDEFVIAKLDGNVLSVVHRSTGEQNAVPGFVRETIQREARAAAQLMQDRGLGPVRVKIDTVGVGSGIWATLREPDHFIAGVDYVEVSAGAKAHDEKRFQMQRDEGWWNLRTMVELDERGSREVVLDLGDDAEARRKVLAQLNSPRFTVDVKNRIHVESKDDMSKRGIASPDVADALWMACYEPRPGLLLPSVGPLIVGGPEETPLERGPRDDFAVTFG